MVRCEQPQDTPSRNQSSNKTHPGAGQSLASPTATIAYVTLGRGTQNYTCASSGVAPVSVGANATLYDASALLQIPSPWGLQALEAAPSVAINVDESDIPAIVQGAAIGHHYFNGGGQPTFDLGAHGVLVGKKVGDIPAPANAVTGPNNQPTQDYGAVDWLNLVDAGTSVTLKEVYRVECAGGHQPATCSSAGDLFQQYACLYWFYS